MGKDTKIEWATHTFNPWVGCQKVGPGCENCYAEAMMDHRLKTVQWGPHGTRRRTSPSNWRKPLVWNAEAVKARRTPADWTPRPRVFCASLADWADTHDSVKEDWRMDLGDLITKTPDMDWLLLTKRIGNVDEVLGAMFTFGVPKNVWLGITVVNQAEANRDIPRLLTVAEKREIDTTFLSMEPLLGDVDLTKLRPDATMTLNALTGQGEHMLGMRARIRPLGWVIVGGESGPDARPMHPQHARNLRDQCVAAGTPFMFKQWGEYLPDSQRMGEELPNNGHGIKVGKKAAGRLLDGRTWDQVPERIAA